MLALRLLSEGGEGPSTELLWIVYLGVGLFFLVVLTGWLTAGRRPDQPGAKQEAGKKSTEKKKRVAAKSKSSRKK